MRPGVTAFLSSFAYVYLNFEPNTTGKFEIHFRFPREHARPGGSPLRGKTNSGQNFELKRCFPSFIKITSQTKPITPIIKIAA